MDHAEYTSWITSCFSLNPYVAFFVYRRRAEDDAWDWILSNDLGEAQVSGYKRYCTDWSPDLTVSDVFQSRLILGPVNKMRHSCV